MKKLVYEYLMTTIGIALVSAGMYFFLIPNNLAAGGVSGLGIIIGSLSGLPIGALMLMMNVILFIIAFIVLGTSFGVKTIYASLGLSGMIWGLERIYPLKSPLVADELMLQLIFGILISGAGMGIVFNQNASTGGTDIIAKIINKFFHVDIGKAVLMSDFVITVFAAATFGIKLGLYALLGVIINGFVIDGMIEGMNICKNVVIISSRCEEVKAYIIHQLGRGATVYYAKGAYSDTEKQVITTVVGRKQFIKLRGFIKDIDKEAFITVNNVHEIFGEGFKNISE
jgi:uncharacterized membrane-anchored protein YitT (DUF2179 family)